MTIPKQILLDTVKNQLYNAIKKVQQEKQLSSADVETILYQLLTDFKSEKEAEYSTIILDMAIQLQKLEEEKKKAAQDSMQIKEESEKED